MAYTGCLILISLFGIGAYCSTSVMLRAPIDVHNSDMSDVMEEEAFQVALMAVNMYENDNDIARYIKKVFERRYGGYWNCIVGICGNAVTYRYSYIIFHVGGKRILLFRSS